MPACQGGAQAICAAAYGARNNVMTKEQIADRDACLIRKNSSPSRTRVGWIKFHAERRASRHDFSIDAALKPQREPTGSFAQACLGILQKWDSLQPRLSVKTASETPFNLAATGIQNSS